MGDDIPYTLKIYIYIMFTLVFWHSNKIFVHRSMVFYNAEKIRIPNSWRYFVNRTITNNSQTPMSILKK